VPATIYNYDNENDVFSSVSEYDDLVCDGVGVARTRARIALDDIEYRWNTSVQFDTHRSMNIALIDINGDRNIIGFLTFIIDQDYLVNDYIQPLLTETFGDEEKSGVAVWLHNWVQDEVLATNAANIEYDVDLVDYRQVFPNFFQNWNIKIRYNTNEAAVVYNESLTKNLLVLGAAVSLLIGAMFFMFNTAQKERKLAMRQAGFLANVTHELKTPLAVMQAAGENIADGRVKDEQRLKKYGDHIYNEAIRLRKMIESLLDVAKADAGESFVQPVPVNIGHFTLEFVDNNRPYLEQKGFEVEASIPEDLPQIYADPDSLETILNNLTENAIKYSPETKYVGYSLEEEKNEIVLRVSDKGVGIPKKAQRHIFDKFYRVEDSLTASTKGHGLGLSIVKNYVELNGATIEVESEAGNGTTFILRFPVLDENTLAAAKELHKRPMSETETEQIEYVG
jgi:signal transduction histidine kinase